MDGQFHAIEFDPSATATEVLKLVKAKIGLRDNAQGETYTDYLSNLQIHFYLFEKPFWLLHFGKCVYQNERIRICFVNFSFVFV
jgi:hypothetical protein